MVDASICYIKSAENEFPDPITAEIRGEIPKWLNGSHYRNGPAKFEIGNDHYEHYFDGLAMVQKFTIKDGQVQYRSKFLRSNTYKRNMAANRIVVSEFGTMAHPDPCKSFFRRYFSFFYYEISDNTSINVFPVGDELYCTTETNYINKIDPSNLDVMERDDLKKLVSVNLATAHPHYENEGATYNLGMGRGNRGLEYFILKIAPPGNETNENKEKQYSICARVPPRWKFSPSYMHSFGMTENYFVIVESALHYNIFKILLKKITGMPITNILQWVDDVPTLIHLVSRETGEEVKCYDAPGFFTFHHVNAYEDDGHVVVDMICFKSGKFVLKINKEKFTPQSSVTRQNPPLVNRYVLPLDCENQNTNENLVKLSRSNAKAYLVKDKVGKVTVEPEQLSEMTLEMPQINYRRYNTRDYRYVYGISFDTESNGTTEQLIKCDVKTGQAWKWSEIECYPTEPVFVPRPGADLEDDGVILSGVIKLTEDGDRHQFLLILDAQTMKEIGRAVLPQVSVPKTFHGIFIENQL